MVKMKNKTYNILKWLVIVVSPAVTTLLMTLYSIWGWNIPIEAIVGTITAVTTFIGVIIGVSSLNYQKEGEKDGKS